MSSDRLVNLEPRFSTDSISTIFDELADIWDANTSDSSALVTPTGSTSHRVAAAWNSGISTTLPEIELNFGSDTKQVSLYFVDQGNLWREQRVEIFDLDSGETLSTQNVSNFANGKYLKWNVHGHVAIRVTAIKGPNAVLSGVPVTVRLARSCARHPL